jgi:isocitrate lyase
MGAMIEAGAAGVHFEDQLASEKKCGHLGGKVLVPTEQFVRTLVAGRLAADVAGVPTVLIVRTDAVSARLLTKDTDEQDRPFLTGERTPEGYVRVRQGIDAAVARGLAYAPFADMLWCETSTPDLGDARAFAEAVLDRFPDKLLAYNCSPSFNWKRHLDDEAVARFQKELAAMGYRLQFVTLAGFHALNASMFELARGSAEEGDERIRPAPGTRNGAGARRLHGHAAPAGGRHGLLRPGVDGRVGGRLRHSGPRRLDRAGAVLKERRSSRGLSSPADEPRPRRAALGLEQPLAP